MSIVIYTQCFAPKFGGIETVMTNIAIMASQSNSDVVVMADGSKHTSSTFDQLQNFTIHRFDQLKFLRKKIKANFYHHYLKENKVDLVFFDSWKSLEGVERIAKTKYICLVHGNEILNLKKQERIETSFLKADYLIFNSEFTQRLLYKNFPKLKKIKSKIVFPAFIENTNNAKKKSKYDLCTVARLEYRKGHHLVLQAMHKLKIDHNIELKYAILGDGPELSRLKDIATKFNLTKQVEFMSSSNLPGDIYNSSQIHVMPTITTPESIEGFGISNVEAASYGLPCIVSNSGGTPESIGNNGIVVSENNVKELVETILTIRDKYENFSKKSLIFAKKFEKKKKIKEYLDIL
ncbi:MAG: glycosyltransferase family 4 protein [Pelagibacteraceae bacterium]